MPDPQQLLDEVLAGRHEVLEASEGLGDPPRALERSGRGERSSLRRITGSRLGHRGHEVASLEHVAHIGLACETGIHVVDLQLAGRDPMVEDHVR